MSEPKPPQAPPAPPAPDRAARPEGLEEEVPPLVAEDEGEWAADIQERYVRPAKPAMATALDKAKARLEALRKEKTGPGKPG